MQIQEVIVLILSLAALCLYLSVAYFAVTFILICPRLLAKLFTKNKTDLKEIQNKRMIFLVIEFLILGVTVLITFLVSRPFFDTIMPIALTAGGAVFGLRIFFLGCTLVPIVSLLVGSIMPVIDPPLMLIKELGNSYPRFGWLILTSAITALIVAAHGVSIIFMCVGAILTLKHKDLLKRDEESHNIEYYFEKLDSQKTRERELAIAMMGDFDDERVSGRLREHLNYHKKHPVRNPMTGQYETSDMPYYWEYWKVKRVLQKVDKRKKL